MVRLILISVTLSFVALSISAAPAETKKDPTEDIFSKLLKEYKDLLPTEVVETYKSLSGQDKAVLKDVFKNIKGYKNEKEMIAAIKEKDPELGAKIEKLYNELTAKVDKLSDEPKKFANQLIEEGRKLHARYASGEKIGLLQLQEFIQEQIKQYEGLSVKGQDELKETFPGVVKFLKDDKVKLLVAKLLEKNN